MRISHAIDLHKILTTPVVLFMMVFYNNFSTAAWTYLALHGSYAMLWRYKSLTFPDANFEKKASPGRLARLFATMLLYWVAPWKLISSGKEASGFIVSLSIWLHCIGSVLMFGSDGQKYFHLKIRRELITDGFFAHTRNPNYLGEILTYSGFATLSMHWIPWLINIGFWVLLFLPQMRRKDQSLSRYPGWKSYEERTGLLLPKFTSLLRKCTL